MKERYIKFTATRLETPFMSTLQGPNNRQYSIGKPSGV